MSSFADQFTGPLPHIGTSVTAGPHATTSNPVGLPQKSLLEAVLAPLAATDGETKTDLASYGIVTGLCLPRTGGNLFRKYEKHRVLLMD